MGPAALEKATSLHRFATDTGSPLSSFLLVLTDPEALELLEWYGTQYAGTNEVFDLDLAIARRTGNPWPVLENFQVMGLALGKATLVLN